MLSMAQFAIYLINFYILDVQINSMPYFCTKLFFCVLDFAIDVDQDQSTIFFF